ncbi:hypothetical protein BJY01DRAFT_130998 [Aspergillus pseudoustus]|uniref:Uncharacterized protein n=1 Tax=Aspergillus pseudoustus TaxID=1810923 RepID=A0ABR4KH51_9EURO
MLRKSAAPRTMYNQNPWRYSQPPPQQPQNPIVIDSESDDNDDDDDDVEQMPIEFTAGGTGYAPHVGLTGLASTPPLHPHAPSHSHSHSRSHSHAHSHGGPSPLSFVPPFLREQETKRRSRLREERHAALCVLMDRELLTIQALAAQETLPQARRRFLSKLISPDDPDTAAALRADQVLIPISSTPLAVSGSSIDGVVGVSRGIVDVCETDDSGWYREVDTGGKDIGEVGGSGTGGSSPAALGKIPGKGTGTPERTRGKGRVSSGRHSGNRDQTQARERRRRWSGAERQDYGVSMMPP